MASHKLLNDPKDAVDESLAGFVATHPWLRLLEGYRVVVRSDVEVSRGGKVSILCGGGSGHEPVFAGFVGRGCLDAAVAGSVFASPPPGDVLAAIRATASPHGALQFVFNYTGDRLNFGLALERAAAAGLGPVELVVLGEDSALAGKERTAGRRGLAGSLLVLKAIGALAETGKALTELAASARQMATCIGTMGVALSSCRLPGAAAPIFTLAADEMELGLGVHGEPGVKRTKIMSAKETVAAMLKHLTDPASKTSLRLSEGDDVVLLINNLGSLTNLELNVVALEALDWLSWLPEE